MIRCSYVTITSPNKEIYVTQTEEYAKIILLFWFDKKAKHSFCIHNISIILSPAQRIGFGVDWSQQILNNCTFF